MNSRQTNKVKILVFCNYPKIRIESFYYIVIGPNNADGIANSVDPDQTAPLIWVFSVCPDPCPSENLGTLR